MRDVIRARGLELPRRDGLVRERFTAQTARSAGPRLVNVHRGWIFRRSGTAGQNVVTENRRSAVVIGAVIAVCVVLLLLAFLAPRLSRDPERGARRAFGLGSRAGSKAPAPLGRLLSKSFRSGSRAAGRSASAGRRGRGKLPL